MKITCQACAAKYTIADDKVLGKIVKIRCKKCGATIVVNGNDPSATAGGPEPARAFDYAAQGGQAEWTVNVADGDQRTMTDAQVADAYHAGVVTDETFCWRDGMGDWLPLREIDQLYQACTSTRATGGLAGVGLGVGIGSGGEEEEGVTKISDPSAAHYGGAPAPGYAAPMAQGNGSAFAEAAPLAARRPGGRAPAADLFSGAAQAGSEDDVMTSAPAGMPQPHEDDGKLTGQRNENSVLFSLNALTSKGGMPGGGGGMPAGTEASGLIDIRQLGAQIGLGEDKKKSRIDDIMNLGGGGAFAPSLGAPVLAPPPIEEYAPKAEVAAAGGPAASSTKSRMLIVGAVGAGIIVIAGAIGAAVMLMGGKDKETDAEKAAASASASALAAVASAVPSATAAAPDPSAAASDSSQASATPPPSSTAASTPTPTAKPTTATATTAAATAAAATPAATPPPAAATAAAAAAGADQPFNMGEAKAKLGGIAGGVQSCKRGDAAGSGRVVVTFAPSGLVQSAAVSGPGFEGTPTGACIAGRFRSARVPPFSGSPFSVSKSFTIN